MDGSQDNRTAPLALITGGSSGIGRAIAIELARCGFDLVLTARRADALAETAGRAETAAGQSPVIRIAPADLADPDAVANLAESVREQEGRLDVIVNNAGMAGARPFDGPDAIATHDRVMQVNYTAAAHLVGELLPLLRESARARIINIASIAGAYACPETAIYSASKFALVGFSEGLRGQLEPDGIGVTTVLPGPIPTPGWSHESIMQRRYLSVWMAASPEAVARVVRRAATGPRPAATRMIPRMYWVGMLLKALTPPLYRAVTRQIRSGAA